MCSGGFRLFMREMDFEYEATFGEEFSLGDGIWVTVGEPVEFTPSEEVSAMPLWGPLALEDWDQFVRATVTWRNESGGVAQTERVGEEDGQVILDEASGLLEMGGTELEGARRSAMTSVSALPTRPMPRSTSASSTAAAGTGSQKCRPRSRSRRDPVPFPCAGQYCRRELSARTELSAQMG